MVPPDVALYIPVRRALAFGHVTGRQLAGALLDRLHGRLISDQQVAYPPHARRSNRKPLTRLTAAHTLFSAALAAFSSLPSPGEGLVPSIGRTPMHSLAGRARRAVAIARDRHFLREQIPKVAALMDEAEVDVLDHTAKLPSPGGRTLLDYGDPATMEARSLAAGAATRYKRDRTKSATPPLRCLIAPRHRSQAITTERLYGRRGENFA